MVKKIDARKMFAQKPPELGKIDIKKKVAQKPPEIGFSGRMLPENISPLMGISYKQLLREQAMMNRNNRSGNKLCRREIIQNNARRKMGIKPILKNKPVVKFEKKQSVVNEFINKIKNILEL